MFNKKEVAWILIAIIIFEFIIFFQSPITKKINTLVAFVPILIILFNVIAKKISSEYYSIKIEHKIFEFQRFGFYERSKFNKPVKVGLILPFFLSLLSLGTIRMLTFLQFDVKNIPEKRILKQRGYKRKTDLNDSDPAFTAAWGFFSLLLLALFGIIIKFPELTTYSIYYGAWNLIPFGNLDGLKIFFGSVLTWSILAIIYLISVLVVILF